MESWLPKGRKIKLEQGGELSRADLTPALRFHHYSDRFRVLEADRPAKEVLFEDNRIFLFQDFSSGTQRKRQAFNEAIRRLQSLGLHTTPTYKLSCDSQNHRE